MTSVVSALSLFSLLCPFCRTTPETSTEDYDDYEPLFSLGLRSPRQAAGSSRKRQYWEVQDINCQGIPFTTIPGKLSLPFTLKISRVEAVLFSLSRK